MPQRPPQMTEAANTAVSVTAAASWSPVSPQSSAQARRNGPELSRRPRIGLSTRSDSFPRTATLCTAGGGRGPARVQALAVALRCWHISDSGLQTLRRARALAGPRGRVGLTRSANGFLLFLPNSYLKKKKMVEVFHVRSSRKE